MNTTKNLGFELSAPGGQEVPAQLPTLVALYVLRTPVINHERGKADGNVTLTNRTYFVFNFWATYLSFYVNIFHVLVSCALYSIISFSNSEPTVV